MLETIKESVRQVALQAQRDGLCKHRTGNFSVYDSDTGYVVITPSGIDREVLKADDMIVIDTDALVVENLTGLKPSSEVLMHIAVYKKRPDIRAIAHTHSKFATVFSVLNKPVPPFVYEAMFVGCKDNTIPIAPYGRPGTKALAENVAGTLENNDSCLMQAHGAIACHAGTIEDAYLNACFVEELCELYHHILTCNNGEEPGLLSNEELQSWAYPEEIRFS